MIKKVTILNLTRWNHKLLNGVRPQIFSASCVLFLNFGLKGPIAKENLKFQRPQWGSFEVPKLKKCTLPFFLFVYEWGGMPQECLFKVTEVNTDALAIAVNNQTCRQRYPPCMRTISTSVLTKLTEEIVMASPLIICFPCSRSLAQFSSH